MLVAIEPWRLCRRLGYFGTDIVRVWAIADSGDSNRRINDCLDDTLVA